MSILDNIDYNKATQTATFKMVFGNDFQTQANEFLEIYDQESFLLIMDSTTKPLKPKNARVCRFCLKKSPKVKFKNKAHLIPQLLGNKNLLSDFECDNCNHAFGVFESEFANYIGLTRTLTRLSGKKGVPKFKNPQKDFSLWIDENDNIDYTELQENNNVIFDNENNRVTFETTSNPFNSLMVYKCLVKIGISLLKDDELYNYQSTISFLLDNSIKEFNNPFAFVHEYIIPGPYVNYPIILTFKKKMEIQEELIPLKTFVLYFRNSMMQYYLPFESDGSLLNKKGVKPTIKILPPLVNQEWIEKYAKPTSKFTNLIRNYKEKGRTEKITIQLEEHPITKDINHGDIEK